MAHESFESQEIAEILNRDFVSIKVDREERPDVDRVYMTFVQATTGSGGWPMSVWLTPDLKPFYGGTYFPPDARWGRPGFPEILRRDRARVAAGAREGAVSAENLTEQIRGLRSVPPGGAVPDTDASERRRGAVRADLRPDARRLRDAPKFPRPSELLFLLRETARTGDYTPAFMVAKTLQPMALGGMRDHVGGGFHRYSVDANWRVPHFEKMLYDQAQITLAGLETYQLAADRFFADVAEDTLEYVHARDDQSGRRLLFGRGCRQRASGRRGESACAQDGRRVLSVDAGGARSVAQRRLRCVPLPFRHSA